MYIFFSNKATCIIFSVLATPSENHGITPYTILFGYFSVTQWFHHTGFSLQNFQLSNYVLNILLWQNISWNVIRFCIDIAWFFSEVHPLHGLGGEAMTKVRHNVLLHRFMSKTKFSTLQKKIFIVSDTSSYLVNLNYFITENFNLFFFSLMMYHGYV